MAYIFNIIYGERRSYNCLANYIQIKIEVAAIATSITTSNNFKQFTASLLLYVIYHKKVYKFSLIFLQFRYKKREIKFPLFLLPININFYYKHDNMYSC